VEDLVFIFWFHRNEVTKSQIQSFAITKQKEQAEAHNEKIKEEHEQVSGNAGGLTGNELAGHIRAPQS